MTTTRPIYILTLFQPKSVDPTETTVLTPPAGAAHSDAFILSNVDMGGALSGSIRPYMRSPQGRRSRVDPKTKKSDVGQMTVICGDPRIIPAAGPPDNRVRWLTQYLGDSLGVDAILKCRAVIQESTDNGGSFDYFFAGRVSDCKQKENLEFVLTIKDMMDDLKQDIYFRDPSDQVTYAFQGTHFPLTLPHTWLTFPKGDIIQGDVATPPPPWKHYVSMPNAGTLYNDSNRIITKAVFDKATTVKYTFTGIGPATGMELTFAPGRLKLTTQPFAAQNRYDVLFIKAHFGFHNLKFFMDAFAWDYPEGEQFSLPAVTGPVDVRISSNDPPDDKSPIFVDYVHPIQYLRDLCEGKFGFVDSTGALGGAMFTDPLTFDTLIADPSFPPLALYITEKIDRKEHIEKVICLPYGVALLPTGAGALAVIDLRLDKGLDNLITLTDLDLVSAVEGEGWKSISDDAVNRVDAKFYGDRQLDWDKDVRQSKDQVPDIPAGLVVDRDQPLILLDILKRTLDFGEKPFELDMQGFHSYSKPSGFTIAQLYNGDTVQQSALAYVEAATQPFRAGARYLQITCRRTANAKLVQIGTKCSITISTIPDPLTKRRGGSRLGVCIERTEDGPKTSFVFLDLGSVTPAAPPTMGALVQEAANPTNGVTQSMSANAALDPIQLQFLTTDTTVTTPPLDTDPGWNFGLVAQPVDGASYDYDINRVASNSRIWTRARSEPSRANRPGVPSAWVRASGAGYVDTAKITAPSVITVSNIAGGSADVDFTPSNLNLRSQILLHTGSGYTGWSDADVIVDVNPAQTHVHLFGLLTSTAYTVGVRQADAYGGFTDVTQVDFSTTGALLQAPRPAGFEVINPSAISLALFPADAKFRFKIERSTGTITAPSGAWVVINSDWPGDEPTYFDKQPIDGITWWWYRIRHTLAGYTDSIPTDPAKAMATAGYTPPPQVQLPTWNEIKHVTLTLGTLQLEFTDVQDRLLEVWFKHQEASPAVETAFVLQAFSPTGIYTTTVALTPGLSSTITYKIVYYGPDGQLVTIIKTVIFAADGTGGPAGGDLTGFYPDPTVVGFNGYPLDQLATPPLTGQTWVYNATTGFYELVLIATTVDIAKFLAADIATAGLGDGVNAITTSEREFVFDTSINLSLIGWTVVADATGSVVVKTETVLYGSFPSFAEIMASERVTLSSARKNQHTLVTPVTIVGDTVWRQTIVSASTVKAVSVTYHALRT